MTEESGFSLEMESTLMCSVSRNGEPVSLVSVGKKGLRETVADLLESGAPIEALCFASREARAFDRPTVRGTK